METRVPSEQDPMGQQVGVPAAGPVVAGTDERLDRRLSALEARIDDLDEAVREAVPAALRHAVQEELQGVSEDLRRAVSELGRLLLRDLDRLTKLLADHRDTIVERLSEPPEPASAAGVPIPVDADPVARPVDREDEPTPLGGEEGRWRVLPIRKGGRRSHGRPARGDTSPG